MEATGRVAGAFQFCEMMWEVLIKPNRGFFGCCWKCFFCQALEKGILSHGNAFIILLKNTILKMEVLDALHSTTVVLQELKVLLCLVSLLPYG